MMNRLSILVVGAGGHASVVADALLSSGQHVIGFVDNETSLHGGMLCGLPILGDDVFLASHDPAFVRLANGIGGTRGEGLRFSVQKRLESSGWRFVDVRHPTAVVSAFARLGLATQMMANSVVQPGAVVEAGCIVNSGAIVEHDVQLGAFVHVACNATLCGSVRVGAHSHIGASAVVRQGVFLGEGTVVGAGAVVVRNFHGGGTLLGIPARAI